MTQDASCGFHVTDVSSSMFAILPRIPQKINVAIECRLAVSHQNKLYFLLFLQVLTKRGD